MHSTNNPEWEDVLEPCQIGYVPGAVDIALNVGTYQAPHVLIVPLAIVVGPWANENGYMDQ